MLGCKSKPNISQCYKQAKGMSRENTSPITGGGWAGGPGTNSKIHWVPRVRAGGPPRNSVLRNNLQEGAPSRLLLAGWGIFLSDHQDIRFPDKKAGGPGNRPFNTKIFTRVAHSRARSDLEWGFSSGPAAPALVRKVRFTYNLVDYASNLP
jgi:hypothetical protein